MKSVLEAKIKAIILAALVQLTSACLSITRQNPVVVFESHPKSVTFAFDDDPETLYSTDIFIELKRRKSYSLLVETEQKSSSLAGKKQKAVTTEVEAQCPGDLLPFFASFYLVFTNGSVGILYYALSLGIDWGSRQFNTCDRFLFNSQENPSKRPAPISESLAKKTSLSGPTIALESKSPVPENSPCVPYYTLALRGYSLIESPNARERIGKIASQLMKNKGLNCLKESEENQMILGERITMFDIWKLSAKSLSRLPIQTLHRIALERQAHYLIALEPATRKSSSQQVTRLSIISLKSGKIEAQLDLPHGLQPKDQVIEKPTSKIWWRHFIMEQLPNALSIRPAGGIPIGTGNDLIYATRLDGKTIQDTNAEFASIIHSFGVPFWSWKFESGPYLMSQTNTFTWKGELKEEVKVQTTGLLYDMSFGYYMPYGVLIFSGALGSAFTQSNADPEKDQQNFGGTARAKLAYRVDFSRFFFSQISAEITAYTSEIQVKKETGAKAIGAFGAGLGFYIGREYYQAIWDAFL